MRWLSPADDTVRATCPVRLSPLQMCAICSHWAFIHYLSYLHFYGGQLQYLFIYLFFPQIFWLLWVVFSGKTKGEVEKKWNKKIKKSIWTETTALATPYDSPQSLSPLSSPSKRLLYHPALILPPPFFSLNRVASLPLLPSFPPTLQLFTQSWRLESPPLDLAPPLLSVPPVLSGLFAGPPSAALSGVSACEASALQYILLIGSILCIITPSCLWVQLAQSGPSVWSSAR